MPALVSPVKRVKTAHRTPAAPASVSHPAVDLPPAPPSRTRHRLFVGGCPTDLTASQLHTELQRRFSSFGHVSTVDVIAGGGGCKGFAYVELDTDRLAAVLSTFKGSKWKGHWFRVEQAQPDYLTRLKQQQTADDAAQQHTEPGVAEAEAVGLQPMDWENHVYCFRVRPGVRVRIPHRTGVTQFDTVRPLPLDQLGEATTAEEPEVAEREEQKERKETEEAFKQRLQQSKKEVERIWLPEDNTAQQPQPDRLTKKQLVDLQRREREERKQQAEEVDESEEEREEELNEAMVEVADEEELGVVDFDDEERDERKDENAEDNQLDGLTEEERLKRQEEKEWAMLEGGGDEWLDDNTELKDHQHEQKLHESSEAESGPQDVDEWAALESGTAEKSSEEREEDKEEADRQQEESSDEDNPVLGQQHATIDMDDELDEDERDKQTAIKADTDKLSFPKLSAADWFDDEDESSPPPLPPASMEQRMRALSSRLVASRGEFDVRPAYEGSSGQQLLRLKQRYKGDERFALDDRFAAAAIDRHKETQADDRDADEAQQRDTVQVEEGQEGDLKRQLHAETLRALQVLDEVAPGPSRFHVTLPRFSHSVEKPASGSAVSEVEKDAAAIEAELNETEMRKSVTMWRNIQRYNPDKHDAVAETKTRESAGEVRGEVGVGGAIDEQVEERTRPESKAERKRRLKQERQERQRQQREQAANTQPQWLSANDETEQRLSSSQQQSSKGAAALYELGVPRLRDLITDRSTVVQFSFAFDSTATATGTADSTEKDSDVAMNVYAPLPEVFPTRPAPVAVQPPAAVVQPVAGAALVKRGNALPSRSQQRSEAKQPQPSAALGSSAGGGAGRLSAILALAQQAHSNERGSTNTAAASAADSSDEDADDAVFMRRTADGDVESMWRQQRTNVREEYKKKNKSAVRQESNMQVRGASLPWAKSKRKAAAE